MKGKIKNQSQMLSKFGITELNPMQLEAQHFFHSSEEIVLLSPTGSGKTLAFLLPLISRLRNNAKKTQALIIAPSRELVIQITQVARDLGSGFKINSVYGGRRISKDKDYLQHAPAILIGTPGRLADHLRRGTVDASGIKYLVLDEYDKALEVGFEEEMKEIYSFLDNVEQKLLTSATQGVEIPEFIEMNDPHIIDYLNVSRPEIKKEFVNSPSKDKLDTLVDCLNSLGGEMGIVFCNYKESIDRISEYLHIAGIDHGCFFGGLDQIDRERALIKFRNKSYKVLLATDLAARGIDVPAIDYIVHYHLPQREEEFIHRNGRTARMQRKGKAIVIKWRNEALPEFLQGATEMELLEEGIERTEHNDWTTIFISGGRQAKISKGDIAGFLFKKGKLKSNELGMIELKEDCAFAAVKSNKVNQLIKLVDNEKMKNRKVRVRSV